MLFVGVARAQTHSGFPDEARKPFFKVAIKGATGAHGRLSLSQPPPQAMGSPYLHARAATSQLEARDKIGRLADFVR